MPLVATGDIVGPAHAGRGCAPAFNVVQIEHVTAIIAAAEQRKRPVILQLSHNAVRYHGALEPIGSAMLAAARLAEVPVAVHLDHAESADLVRRAVDLGFSSVMFDASTLEYEANVAATAEVAKHCHEAGVWVEAELGEVGGKDGAHAPGARTDPQDAVRFVAGTGVDALAVAVGTSHAMLSRDAEVDLELVARLRAEVPVPLVLHGSSGVSDEGLREAVLAGVSKINIATQLNKTLTATVRAHLAERPELVDPRKYLGAGRTSVTEETARLLDVLDGRV
ncbi:class II fructose-bisphosphate aldolase [Saccharopolyspora taberi]|uniref:Class II fructose-bisphosphate aldolase n=1 Tax=Saccharopolyspora taberi TaxID=60895 RepID=A0ABN3VCB7_9PSEU